MFRICNLLLLIAMAIPQIAAGEPTNEEIDRLFRNYSGNVPGASVLVVKDGEIKYSQGYGMANLEEGIAATPSSNYRLASVTKAFTAMAIMILQERGLLDYNDSVTDHVENFPTYGNNIKIRHLLGHTGGLRDYENYIPNNQNTQLTDSDVVDILRRRTNGYFNPGSQYRYSNSGYATLAVIVTNVSGQSFHEFLSENIFIPLTMDNTIAYVNGENEVVDRVYGYSRRGSRYERTDQSITSAVLGDGGVYTSALDYLKWDEALYSDILVSNETLAEAFTSGITASGSRTGYGFGWKLDQYRGHRRISHTGSTIGFRTAVQRFPDQNFTVLVMINRAGSEPWNVAAQIADMFLR